LQKEAADPDPRRILARFLDGQDDRPQGGLALAARRSPRVGSGKEGAWVFRRG